MKSNYASAALPAKGKEPKAPAPVTPSLLSNKVKTKDLYRSQVFSAKSQKQQQQQPPSTLYVNKNVDPGEATAAIALLNKHEKAMKRYEAAAAQQQSQPPRTENSVVTTDYAPLKSQLKPEWNKSTRSPSQKSAPCISQINEPEGYQLIQLKQTNPAVASLVGASAENPS